VISAANAAIRAKARVLLVADGDSGGYTFTACVPSKTPITLRPAVLGATSWAVLWLRRRIRLTAW
jgi:hypothetical protein